MGALSNFQVRWAYKQNKKKRNEENKQSRNVAEIKAVWLKLFHAQTCVSFSDLMCKSWNVSKKLSF